MNIGRALRTMLAACVMAMGVGFVFAGKVVAAEATVLPVVVDENDIKNLPSYGREVKTEKNVVPFQVTVPGQWNIRVNLLDIADVAKISVFVDEACSVPASANYYFYLSPNEVTTDRPKVGNVNVLNPGTYYLAVEYNNANVARENGWVNFTPYLYSRADRGLDSGVWSSILAPSATQAPSTYFQFTVPSKGYVGVEVNSPSAASAYVSLCGADRKELVASDFKTGELKYYPVSKGTYYLSTSGVANEWMKVKYGFEAQFALKAGVPFTYTQMGRANMDFQFKAGKTGVVTLTNQSEYGMGVVLLDAKKKKLTKSNTSKNFNYAVKKGKTYYFRISNTGMDTISYSIKKAGESKNTTKKKAVLLEKNKKKTCLILAGEAKKAYWYKVEIPSKGRKLKVKLTRLGSGSVVYRLCDQKGKKVDGSLVDGKLTSTEKLAKGNYYVVVEPSKKLANKTTGRIDLKLK